jgi:hypothetical protein
LEPHPWVLMQFAGAREPRGARRGQTGPKRAVALWRLLRLVKQHGAVMSCASAEPPSSQGTR